MSFGNAMSTFCELLDDEPTGAGATWAWAPPDDELGEAGCAGVSGDDGCDEPPPPFCGVGSDAGVTLGGVETGLHRCSSTVSSKHRTVPNKGPSA